MIIWKRSNYPLIIHSVKRIHVSLRGSSGSWVGSSALVYSTLISISILTCSVSCNRSSFLDSAWSSDSLYCVRFFISVCSVSSSLNYRFFDSTWSSYLFVSYWLFNFISCISYWSFFYSAWSSNGLNFIRLIDISLSVNWFFVSSSLINSRGLIVENLLRLFIVSCFGYCLIKGVVWMMSETRIMLRKTLIVKILSHHIFIVHLWSRARRNEFNHSIKSSSWFALSVVGWFFHHFRWEIFNAFFEFLESLVSVKRNQSRQISRLNQTAQRNTGSSNIVIFSFVFIIDFEFQIWFSAFKLKKALFIPNWSNSLRMSYFGNVFLFSDLHLDIRIHSSEEIFVLE